MMLDCLWLCYTVSALSLLHGVKTVCVCVTAQCVCVCCGIYHYRISLNLYFGFFCLKWEAEALFLVRHLLIYIVHRVEQHCECLMDLQWRQKHIIAYVSSLCRKPGSCHWIWCLISVLKHRYIFPFYPAKQLLLLDLFRPELPAVWQNNLCYNKLLFVWNLKARLVVLQWWQLRLNTIQDSLTLNNFYDPEPVCVKL